MSERLSLESLTQGGGISGLDISPDGRVVVFGSSAGDQAQIYSMPIEGGTPTQLTHDRERSAYPRWSPRGDLIAFARDVGGDENWAVYVMDPKGGEARDITNCPGKMTEQHSWSADGSKIAFVSNRDGQFDVYYVDVPDGTVHRVTNYPSVHHSPAFSPDGSKIAFASNRTKHRSNWDTFVVDLATGQERQITQHQGEADEMSYYAGQTPRWSPDGKRILVASSVPGNYDIMAVDVDTLEKTWIARSRWDEGNAQWSPDGSQVAYTVNEDGNIVLYVTDPAKGRAWPVSQPEGVSGSVGMRGKGMDFRWTPDGKSIVYGYSGPAEAGSIWIVPAEGGESRCLYSSTPEDIDRTQLVHPQLIHYPSFDGRQISAFLYRPPEASGPGPVIIMPHGGPTGQSSNSWNPTVQYLVSRGYTVLEPNFRGSTGYGTEFQWLNKNDWGGGDLKDVMAATDWLEQEGIANRFGITGGSYGGFMTLNAITKYPDRWSAAASLVGITNLVTMYEAGREDMKQFQARNIGTPEENPDLYFDRSPLNFVDRITCPLLILQGERDPRVPLREAEQIRDSLEAKGKVYDYVVYEHEGHGFSRRENRLDSVRRIADFFDKYLGAVPAGAS